MKKCFYLAILCYSVIGAVENYSMYDFSNILSHTSINQPTQLDQTSYAEKLFIEPNKDNNASSFFPLLNVTENVFLSQDSIENIRNFMKRIHKRSLLSKLFIQTLGCDRNNLKYKNILEKMSEKNISKFSSEITSSIAQIKASRNYSNSISFKSLEKIISNKNNLAFFSYQESTPNIIDRISIVSKISNDVCILIRMHNMHEQRNNDAFFITQISLLNIHDKNPEYISFGRHKINESFKKGIFFTEEIANYGFKTEILDNAKFYQLQMQ